MHIFHFPIDREPLYRELLEACTGSSDVGHCGGSYCAAPLDLSSIYGLLLVWDGMVTMVA